MPGSDEFCSEFLRCPDQWNDIHKTRQISRGVVRRYDPLETAAHGMPLAAQIMGSNAEILETVARILATKGAPRVDLNMGCPANVVTGKGAGSSMLRDPADVFKGCSAIVRGVAGTAATPTAKMRAGFTDAGLFDANLDAVEASGVRILAIHPRTKVQRYEGSADWTLIARARARLTRTAVIGNGDVTTPARAVQLVQQTGVGGVMIGRGAIRDPLIFWRTRLAFGESIDGARAAGPVGAEVMANEGRAIAAFLRAFSEEVAASNPESWRARVNRVKQICSYLFTHNEALEAALPGILRVPSAGTDPDAFTDECCRRVEALWRPGPSWTSQCAIQGHAAEAEQAQRERAAVGAAAECELMV